MASGDVVSNVTVGSFTFQPAAGVTILITQFLSGEYNNTLRGRGDIDFAAYNMQFGYPPSSVALNIRYWNTTVNKFFIDNSSYLYFVIIAGRRAGFTGIQI